MRLAILFALAATALSAQAVEGRVVNELTGGPVAGVKVILFPKPGQAPPSEPLRAITGERIKQAVKVTVRDHESTTVEVRLVY